MTRRYALGCCTVLIACAEAPPTAPATPTASTAPPLVASTTPVPAAPVAAISTPAQAGIDPPGVPDAIRVPESANAVLMARGKGVQIYECGPNKDQPKLFEWTLKAPEATLEDAQGKSIGKHSAGPTWESEDGSKVIGVLKAKVDAPVATAIPWVLVAAQATEGTGVLSHVAYVQRVDTEGGKPPQDGCDKNHDQAQRRINYSATYYFFTDTTVKPTR